jgi:hypothetical protein
MSTGMGTLARASAIANLYGAGGYGTIASVAAAQTTTARATGPVAAAVYAAAVGSGALLERDSIAPRLASVESRSGRTASQP